MRQIIHFISGLPRSGSTLLANILAQNPRFHSTATSGILEILFIVRNGWDKIIEFRAFEGDGSVSRRVFLSKTLVLLSLAELVQLSGWSLGDRHPTAAEPDLSSVDLVAANRWIKLTAEILPPGLRGGQITNESALLSGFSIMNEMSSEVDQDEIVMGYKISNKTANMNLFLRFNPSDPSVPFVLSACRDGIVLSPNAHRYRNATSLTSIGPGQSLCDSIVLSREFDMTVSGVYEIDVEISIDASVGLHTRKDHSTVRCKVSVKR